MYYCSGTEQNHHRTTHLFAFKHSVLESSFSHSFQELLLEMIHKRVDSVKNLQFCDLIKAGIEDLTLQQVVTGFLQDIIRGR